MFCVCAYKIDILGGFLGTLDWELYLWGVLTLWGPVHINLSGLVHEGRIIRNGRLFGTIGGSRLTG